MLLSIGMIVKNEEKLLERCLTALKPILDNVDSELIIADTGSTDRTVEIAKKFTDNVYHFEWINDFSAARNSTMERAQGEWYMFLDADEIFQSCDNIISFFNSEEYKKYGTATYVVRSYTDESNPNAFSDAHAVRLEKRFEDVRFENAIHEALSPIHQPIKHLEDIVDHYGYYFRNNGAVTELAEVKSKRNLELLLKSVEEKGDAVDFSVYKEIADCYQLIEDMDNALKYINIGLEKLDHSIIAITAYYSFKASALLSLNRYEEVIETVDKYFSKENPSHTKTLASDFDMYAMRGESKYRTGKSAEAVDDFIQFFKIYNSYEKGRLNTEDLLYNTIKVRGKNLKTLYNLFLFSCIESAKFNTAEDNMKGFPVDKYNDDRDYIFRHTHMRVQIMDKVGYKNLKKFYSQLDDYNKKQFFRIARWVVFKSERIEELLAAMLDCAGDNKLIIDAVNIYRAEFVDNNLQYEMLEEFIQEHKTLFNADILCLMLKNDMDISPFLTAPDFDAAGCIRAVFTDFAAFVKKLEHYDVSKLSDAALRNAASVYGRAMVEANGAKKDVTLLFERYGEVAARWLAAYPDETNIPGDIQAGRIVYSVIEARRRNDLKLCVSEMRRLIKACPDFAPYVSAYQKKLKNDLQPALSNEDQSQMAQMAGLVKNNIRGMIAAGNIAAAEKNFKELAALCPNDPDIALIRSEIEKAK